MDWGGRHRQQSRVSPCDAEGSSAERPPEREGSLATGPAVCRGGGPSWNRAPRLATHMREAVPRRWRRVGADPVATWPRIGSDHRTLLGNEAGPGPRAERWDQAEADSLTAPAIYFKSSKNSDAGSIPVTSR